MIKMTLCPNCRTIQKAGTNCTICKAPVPNLVLVEEMHNGLPRHTWVREDRIRIACKPRVIRAMAVSGD